MEYDNIDIDRLRSDLIDYFGSATPFYPVAYMDVIDLENASDKRIIEIAISNNINLDNYKVYSLNL